MDVINTSPALDCKTMIAILNANPDGVAILGAFNGMETLAREDPEGCVRLSPELPMNNAALATLLHCTETIVEKTIEVFGKLQRINVKDGLIKVLGMETTKADGLMPVQRKKAATTAPVLTEEALAKKRAEARRRKAKSRARQKQEQVTAAESNVTPDTNCDECDPYDNECDQRDTVCDSQCDMRDNVCDQRDSNVQSRTVTAFPKSVTGCDSRCDTRPAVTAIYNRNINNNNITSLHAPYAHKPVSKYENMIPVKYLPEDYRNVLDVWNRLPLPKYRGLMPDLLKKMKFLLQRYGKDTLCKTIAGIANNPFLLGKKEGKGWSVSLAWLLESANFAKVLSGKYRDEKMSEDGCGSWHIGEPLPFYLPGEGPEGFTPEEQRQALRNLSVPTTPAQLKIARLIGLPGYKEVTA